MRKILEDLIFSGNVEETFEVLGRKWKISTITSEQQLKATAVTSNYDTLARVNALKIQILSFSLRQVDDIELNDPEETLEMVKRLPQPLLNALFKKYEVLQQKQEEALKDIDELKN